MIIWGLSQDTYVEDSETIILHLFDFCIWTPIGKEWVDKMKGKRHDINDGLYILTTVSTP